MKGPTGLDGTLVVATPPIVNALIAVSLSLAASFSFSVASFSILVASLSRFAYVASGVILASSSVSAAAAIRSRSVTGMPSSLRR